jgi:hypothetical protein
LLSPTGAELAGPASEEDAAWLGAAGTDSIPFTAQVSTVSTAMVAASTKNRRRQYVAVDGRAGRVDPPRVPGLLG